MPTFREIGKALEPVQDPELHMSVVDLGLIYGVKIEKDPAAPDSQAVTVTMSLTSPACPYGPMLMAWVHGAIAKVPGVREVDVDLAFEPLWDPRTMASDDAKDGLGIY